jgi:hypothetical protein
VIDGLTLGVDVIEGVTDTDNWTDIEGVTEGGGGGVPDDILSIKLPLLVLFSNIKPPFPFIFFNWNDIHINMKNECSYFRSTTLLLYLTNYNELLCLSFCHCPL